MPVADPSSAAPWFCLAAGTSCPASSTPCCCSTGWAASSARRAPTRPATPRTCHVRPGGLRLTMEQQQQRILRLRMHAMLQHSQAPASPVSTPAHCRPCLHRLQPGPTPPRPASWRRCCRVNTAHSTLQRQTSSTCPPCPPAGSRSGGRRLAARLAGSGVQQRGSWAASADVVASVATPCHRPLRCAPLQGQGRLAARLFLFGGPQPRPGRHQHAAGGVPLAAGAPPLV